MTATKPPSPKAKAAAERQARLAEELRANLRKRRVQQRARREVAEDDESEQK